ncbi:MAG: DinB family protein [Pricia sp.]|nr:DinB family protein [Pricia sp.]
MAKDKIKALLHSIRTSFQGKPWYGISVMEKLEAVDWNCVNDKPQGSSKSIAILLKHMINWRVLVLKKLEGNKQFDIEINSADDWPILHIDTEAEWNDLISELRETQEKLIQALTRHEDEFLALEVPGRDYDFDFLLKGIIEHDIYHLGQIALIYSMVKPH